LIQEIGSGLEVGSVLRSRPSERLSIPRIPARMELTIREADFTKLLPIT
jgi:hypothetical protein